MRRLSPLLLCGFVLGAFGWATGYCYERNAMSPVVVALFVLLLTAWITVDQFRRVLAVLTRARRIRLIRAERSPAAICTDDIH